MNRSLQTKVKASSDTTASFTPVQSRLLQRSSADHAGHAAVPPIVHEVLCSPGQPLDPATRTFVEPHFGHDFSRIQAHTDVPKTIQTKLIISQPNDRYEQEADRVAEQVMRMPEPRLQRQVEPEEEEEEETLQTKPLANQITPLIQRRIEPEEEEEPIQAKQTNGQTLRMSPILQTQIHSLRGGGQPLSPSLRNFFEPRFGHDFSQVRVHTDAKATESARAVNARAFTIGRDVVFGAGRYAPETSKGGGLLAHELTHVVQQNGGIRGIEIRRESSIQPRKNLRGVVSERYQKSVGHGIIQRTVELHVNLRHAGRQRQRVKVYNSGGSSVEYLISAGRGNLTSRLIRRRHHPIIAKVGPPPKKTYRWGLQYFAQITSGGIGFHSNIAYPFRSTLCSDGIRRYCRGNQSGRVRYGLTVDGTPRSHGCIRLSHNNSRNLFSRVRVGTRVYIYSRRSWRSPSWSSSPDRALP